MKVNDGIFIVIFLCFSCFDKRVKCRSFKNPTILEQFSNAFRTFALLEINFKNIIRCTQTFKSI